MKRFEIEDIVDQDASGVVFRAVDSSTGREVALRRFFPFGVDGGGLEGDEQLAYGNAVEILTGLQHPGLRAVVGGGCDSVDGLPFIATEWIDGSSLVQRVAERSLTLEEVEGLIQRAIEVSEFLSGALGQEGIWVETELKAIVLGVDGGGHGFTFWASPLKWLGKNTSQRGFASLVSLTEDLMGWRGRLVADHEGRGLARWLNWLRSVSPQTRLGEVREALSNCMKAVPPIAVSRPIRPASKPLALPIKKRRRVPAALFGVLALVSMAAGGWVLIQWNYARIGHGAKVQVQEVLEDDVELDLKPAKKDSVVKTVEPEPEVHDSPVVSSEPAEVVKPAEVAVGKDCFTPNDRDLLIAQDGNMVSLEGVFSEIAFSKSGKTMYLQFSKQAGLGDVRAAVEKANLTGDLTEEKLRPLIGKRIRLRGMVKLYKAGSLQRPVILILNRRSIEVVD
jgi:hypothetical protein